MSDAGGHRGTAGPKSSGTESAERLAADTEMAGVLGGEAVWSVQKTERGHSGEEGRQARGGGWKQATQGLQSTMKGGILFWVWCKVAGEVDGSERCDLVYFFKRLSVLGERWTNSEGPASEGLKFHCPSHTSCGGLLVPAVSMTGLLKGLVDLETWCYTHSWGWWSASESTAC